MTNSTIESREHRTARAALLFSGIAYDGTPAQVAGACLGAAQALLEAPCYLRLPGVPVSVEVGEKTPEMVELLRFPALGGEGQLWSHSAGETLPATARATMRQHLVRIWRVREELAERMREIDRLRFQLVSLQQVARTLAAVRGAEETERLVLDSVGEVFFAWWAALYRTEGDVYRCRATRALRGESVPPVLPGSVVRAVAPPGAAPFAPGEEMEIHGYMPAELSVLAPLDLGDGGAGLLVLGPRMSDAGYDLHDLALLRALADSSAVALRNADLLDRLRAQATMDPLTGCYNRRGFDEHLEAELARAVRYDRPLSLILVDIDQFKRINDELGHDAGDHALRRIGGVLCDAGRATDFVCRYGGEEFAIICPETTKAEAARFAERLRDAIARLPPDPVVPRSLTASLGVSSAPADAADSGELIRTADRALYQAKDDGRNRVSLG